MAVILADEAIPGLDALESQVELVRLPADDLCGERVRSADALLVRTITPVGAELLTGSRVRLVATASSGIDHVDTSWLASRGIRFASARGCNADAVVDYAIASLAALNRLEPPCRCGVIGVGEVGSRLARRLESLGWDCILHDPPRAEREPGFPSQPLVEALECEVVSVHVSLVQDGPYPSVGLLGEDALRRMGRGQVLINAARGQVVETLPLLRRLEAGNAPTLVFDCWPGEPRPLPELITAGAIATPHIAGYSRRGKAGATRAVLRAVADEFGLEFDYDDPQAHVETLTPAPDLSTTLCRALPLTRLSEQFRNVVANDPRDGFSRQRRNYPLRAEFSELRVAAAGLSPQRRAMLAAAGFSVDRGNRECSQDA